MKIPFEIVSLNAEKLIRSVVKSTDSKERDYYLSAYNAYLKSCGWTPTEFDAEQLRRIDKSWDENLILN